MTFTIIVIIAALLAGLVKGGLGPVPGALIVPLLSLTMPVSRAVGLTLPMFMIGDWLALPVYWRQWDSKALRLMLPAAAVGVLMGAALLKTLPDEVLRKALGIFTLAAVVYKLGSDSLSALKYSPRDWHGWLAGWGSGLGSALANAGAPPITAYLLLRKFQPICFIGTTAVFFLVVNLLKLPIFVATHVLKAGQVMRIAWALPLIPLGVWMGRWMITRIDTRKFEWLMLALLAWAGISLLLE
jgi:uncharacterized membrane protein YfcA